MKISAYTTTKDCILGQYPLKASIESVLPIVDELVVFDSSRKNDGTLTLLKELQKNNDKIIIHHDTKIDWESKNHGINDGLTKAESRKLCTGNILIQFDVDEIFHEKDIKKWKDLCLEFSTGNIEVLHLPVIEFWGKNKIRIDINPTKERITKNLPYITHGIPKQLRWYNDEGLVFSRPGSDGCNLINSITFEPIRHYMPNIDFSWDLRQSSLFNEDSLEVYEKWYKKFVINNDKYPCVYHYSWFDIKRKVNSYKNFWTEHWISLYGENPEKPNPMFPNIKKSEIVSKMIEKYSLELEEKTSGWIFHQPWDGSSIFGLTLENSGVTHPSYIKSWIEKLE
jgi:hypothetical protein